MRSERWLRGPAAVWILVVCCAPTLFGCREREGIRTYTVATPAQDSRTTEVAGEAPPRGEPRDRMIAAVLPAADRVWFLKATGPIDALASAEPPVDEFLKSVRLDEGEPRWDTPKGWKEQPASGMRLATLVIPVEDKELELSVIGLPLVGDRSSQLLDNVNRWRGQLKLGPWSAAELAENTTPLEAAEGATLFDAAGWFDSGGMTPPMAAARPAPAATPPAREELTFDTPDGWSPEPGSAMRKASFATPAGAVVTAFAFPAGAPAMADPLANVNRWRGEVGLGPTTEEELRDESEEIRLSGDAATYVEIQGETETTFAAMSKRGGRVWFFKLRGPSEAVADERDAFHGWLDSIEISD